MVFIVAAAARYDKSMMSVEEHLGHNRSLYLECRVTAQRMIQLMRLWELLAFLSGYPIKQATLHCNVL